MQKISGYLIFISFLLTLFSYFFAKELVVASAIPLWISVILLFPTLKNKRLLLILLSLSAILLLCAFAYGYKISFKNLLSINQYLITLLIGVGFLRLIANPKVDKEAKTPKGKNAFFETYLSLHLFASTINLSALLLFADKFFQKTKKLTHLQVILLTRSFSSDAYWSPFFVAFGAATTFTPHVDLTFIILAGLSMAFFSLVLTYIDVKDNKELELFEGYPLNYQSLLLPFSLAVSILIVNHFFPQIKIIILVALFSLVLALFVVLFKEGIARFLKVFRSYIEDELPKMKTEVSLFLIAGFFGVSVSVILEGIGFDFPFEYFDYKVAALTLLLFILVSLLGVHTIICVSIFGHMLQDFNHTLVAVTFLMAWASTVAASPFSGVNLTLHSRYEVNTKDILKLNLPFLLKIYLLCCVVLFIISYFLGL